MNAYDLARKYDGLKEWAEGSNPEIDKMFADVGHAGNRDDVPWCAAFVGAMLKRAGLKGTGKLNARSYLDWGVPVDRKDAKPGDVVVFKRGNSTWQGHVAFFVKDKGALIDVLGGNQSNAVNVKGYQASQLLGIRRAPAAPQRPATAPQAPTVAPAPQKPAKAPAGPAIVVGGIIAAAVALVSGGWGWLTSWF